MEKMIAVAQEETSDYVAKQKHPHIAQLIGSYKVGKLTQDKSLCKSLFPCDGSNEQIQVNTFLYHVLMNLKSSVHRSSSIL